MKCVRYFFAILVASISFSAISSGQQPWSGILSAPRATDWTQAGLPRDIPPDVLNSWTQCTANVPGCSGSSTPAIPSCGSSGSGVSPSACGITAALSNCGTNHYVQLAGSSGSPANFYLTGSINLPSNCVLRGGGAAYSRIHAVAAGSYGCNGMWGLVCIIGSNTYGNGNCGVWPCPSGTSLGGIQHTANWIGNYSQGTTQITVDSDTGIVANVTPIVLDECDLGFSGNTSNFACGAPSSGNAGAITAANVSAGGSGYNVGDTGTISAVGPDFGMSFGSNTATYQVTSVSGGAVAGFTVTSGGFGYTYTEVGSPTSTKATSGSGSGLTINVTNVGAYDDGSIMNCAVSMICTNQSPSNTSIPARSQEEVFLVTAISGSGPYTLTLNHAITHANWASSQGPKAWWGSSTVTNLGIENVELDPSAYEGNCGNPGCMNAVGVNSASKWWVVGVASNVANFFHVNAWYTSNGLVRDSYFYLTANKGTQSYGIGCTSYCGNLLFENNVIQGVVDPENVAGTCNACVFAYNFAVNQADNSTAFQFASNPMHTASTDYILEEGNIGAGVNLDVIHGPHSVNTFFRNYFNGYSANEGVIPSQDTVPIMIGAYSRYNNVIGNVLGTAGYHKTYKCAPTSALQHSCPGVSSWEALTIFNIGWSHSDQLDYNNNPPLLNDTIAAPGTMLWGNYDVVNNAVQWNTSEVPTGDPNYPNSGPSGQSLPASFYNGVTLAHSSCGTGLPFWKNPTTSTCPPYPSIGPDVTNGDIGMCTSGTYKWSRALTSAQCSGGNFQPGSGTNGGYGNSNPAMRCYFNQMGGPPDGTGGFLTFNAASCYAADTASGPVPPPPTGVTGTVNPVSQ
jgi:hypothetical protein